MQTLARSLIVAISTFISFFSHAIVMRHDVKADNYQVYQAQYESVIDLNFLTGTLISPQWILTAAHGTPYMPGGQKITINHQGYHVTHIISHPKYNDANQNHDLALLRLDRPVSSVKSSDIYMLSDEIQQHVWFVGRGDIGTGDIGISGPSTVLNHAENVIESTDDYWLIFDFDSPESGALALEGISGPGDSGGPAFINTESGLKVVGVSSHQRNNDNGEGLYGVEEYYTRTSTHQKWIKGIMAKKGEELDKVSLERPIYLTKKATIKEEKEIIGRYRLADGSEFVIEPCDDNICYRWADLINQTVISKSTVGIWFTPEINRTFKVELTEIGKEKKIVMNDFHGERLLTLMVP